ncbi:MAG: cation:proton antiporter [Candidatus Riflebacteria bacterium]|nr:cation:proton antiporter [Candidatus Riflebacteria bacterium]
MSNIATDLILIILGGFIGGLLARALKQPLVVGYIFIGILLGPNAGIVKVSEISNIEHLADIGASLLLFSLGMEFSLRDLRPIWRITILGTSIQVLITFIYGAGIAWYLGWNLLAALWFGGAVVSSSSALILRTLKSRNLKGTLSGRVMMGVSIMQDLLVIPLLILLVSLSKGNLTVSSIILPIVSSFLFLILIWALAELLIPRLLKKIASLRSPELFMLATISIGLGVGYVSHLFGLSTAFGAFIAGLVLSESDFGKKALSEMVPLRDLFGLLFFASIGMLCSPAFVASNFLLIFALVALFAGGKGLVLALVAHGYGYRRIIPLAMMLGMVPISEIAFVLARNALIFNAISNFEYQIMLNVVIVSMIIGPLTAAFASPVYNWFKRIRPEPEVESINFSEHGLVNHVVVCGGSRLSEYLAVELKQQNKPFVIIEPDYQSFLRFAGQGMAVILGEPEKAEMLSLAKIGCANLLIVEESGLIGARQVIREAKALRSDLRVLFVASSQEAFEQQGVQIIQHEKQLAVELARRAVET